MDLELSNKVFLVTGGGTGIGGAISLALANEGAVPIVVSRDRPDARLSEALDDLAPRWRFIATELSDDAACAAAVEECSKAFGQIDGLVNNAGFNDGVGLEAGPDAFRNSIEQNLVHYYTMAHLCLPFLRISRGSILNIASKTALTGQGGTSAYAAAKGAQLALTREWAASLLDNGIRVNAIVPSEVLTPMYERWLASLPNPDQRLRDIAAQIPLGQRMTSVEEIAAAAVFLLSNVKSGHTTGQWHFVDGGYVHLDRALR